MKKLNYKNVMNHKSLTKDKGITLIALIVTIIIVLILASVSVAVFSNNNIIKKSKFAGEAYQNKINEEEKAIQNYATTMNEYTIADNGRDTITISKEEYENLTTIKEIPITIESNYVNGNKIYARKIGNIVTLEINGDKGTKNIQSNKIIKIASGLPKCANEIQELNITLDDPNGYQRSWIDSSGNIFIYTSLSNYTGNIFIGGTYITND